MKLKIRKPHFVSAYENIAKIFQNRQSKMIFASIAFAFVISFSFVGMTRLENNGQSLLASVANISENSHSTIDFEADTALVDETSHFSFIAGKTLKKVEKIEGIIAFDPNRGLDISANSFSLIKLEEGIYRFEIIFDNKDIFAGENFAKISKTAEISVPMTITDLQFVSEGQRYNLTNIIK